MLPRRLRKRHARSPSLGTWQRWAVCCAVAVTSVYKSSLGDRPYHDPTETSSLLMRCPMYRHCSGYALRGPAYGAWLLVG
jgi:hypothetical protein